MDIQTLALEFYDYSHSIRGYTKATLRRYRFVINSFCKLTGIRQLNEITPDKIRTLFYEGRVKRSWSTRTYLVYKVTLTVFFRWCQKRGLLFQNPLEGIESPKVEKSLPKALNKQSAFKILEVVHNYPYQNEFLRQRNYALFSLFIFAGLRKQEVINLKTSDIDLRNNTIFVRLGKGNKDRIVPINLALAQILRRYLEERNKLQKTCPEFFTSYIINTGFTDSGMRRLVKKINSASGIKFSPHILRHTFATLMIEGGCDIYSLSKLMGHNNIQTTTIYLSASTEHLKTQILKHPLSAHY